ncbi:MAG: glucose-1-phosphate cytidylyltransferase [Elusimicrobiota bacterium]
MTERLKAVILAGGLGTRIREETEYKPKPMVTIGERPILWHIMKAYAHYQVTDFVLCLGYKGDVIRDYFLQYELRHRDVTLTLGSRDIEVHKGHLETGWKITLAETGVATQTGGRLKRAAAYLDGERFMLTYGDGVADVDITALAAFHRKHGKLATVTAVRPSSRFGELLIQDGLVEIFQEKPQVHSGWINGGFFIFERKVLEMLQGDDETLEAGLLPRLAQAKQLAVYQHPGFWQCMDTFREMKMLNDLWSAGKAPWAVWR